VQGLQVERRVPRQSKGRGLGEAVREKKKNCGRRADNFSPIRYLGQRAVGERGTGGRIDEVEGRDVGGAKGVRGES